MEEFTRNSLLKPGKPADESNSFRPVSLLCPAIKILERLILPYLNECLPIPTFQHGFKAKHSTVTALNQINLDISAGFNFKPKPAKRTVLLQLDLSKAFDMVNLTKLQDDRQQITPPAITETLDELLPPRQTSKNPFQKCNLLLHECENWRTARCRHINIIQLLPCKHASSPQQRHKADSIR